MNEQTPGQPVVGADKDSRQQTTPQTPSPRSGRPSQSRGSRIADTLSTIGILLLAPLVAWLLTLYVFQSYQVDGPSMQQTLQHNDRLIVWKLPRTWSRITGNQYVPKRGDIVIFTQTGLSNYGDSINTKQLVKRVIGLPGDRVVVKNGVVTVYNSEHPRGFVPDDTLPYGENGAIPVTMGDSDVRLSKTQLFVCGDNRPDSLDSRAFGAIQTDQVVGKLVARIYPFSEMERF